MTEAIRKLIEKWRREAGDSPNREDDYRAGEAGAIRACADELAALLHAGEVPQPSEHLAFVAVMNALDVHMPPNGANLLNELRQIAATAGYPWKGAVKPHEVNR